MKWRIGRSVVFLTVLVFSGFSRAARAQTTANDATWSFAVSGDSRNCGDVVMPAIAAGVLKDNASFYWHLGDFRKLSDFDEDIQHQPENIARPLSISRYEQIAWDDFTHWLPNLAYLCVYDHFPTLAEPSLSKHAAYPYGLALPGFAADENFHHIYPLPSGGSHTLRPLQRHELEQSVALWRDAGRA